MLNTEIEQSGVAITIPRLKRGITPAQEGILDCSSHVDAANLAAALDWMKRTAGASIAGGATATAVAKLALVDNLIAWLGDVVLEQQGLVLYDGEIRPYKDLPTV